MTMVREPPIEKSAAWREPAVSGFAQFKKPQASARRLILGVVRSLPEQFRQEEQMKNAFLGAWAIAVWGMGALLGLGLGPARGDVLVPRSGPPLVGRMVERNAREIVFRERVEPGKYVERRLSVDQLLTVVVTIDEARLQALSPERPQEYGSLAEELALMANDLEARDLAIRLSLLAARWGEDEVRHRALLQLVHLARTPEEEVRFRSLAYLVEPGIESAVLDARRQIRPPPGAEELRAVLQVVQALRQGKNAAAQAQLQQSPIQTALEPWSEICSLEQLQRFATTRQRSGEELLQLLRLEYALRQSLFGWPEPLGDDSWGSEIENATVFQPTWDNVSEFRTEENQYVDGQWRSQRR